MRKTRNKRSHFVSLVLKYNDFPTDSTTLLLIESTFSRASYDRRSAKGSILAIQPVCPDTTLAKVLLFRSLSPIRI
ncbi:MAG TPA: hypothetical protein PKD64_01555 [Pirellulaceae bacterium]|nr:hypothetical protein [Pirellulaceae bacterium]HMO90856.1 hypothetical protein [Pirellulaceae bacterium]HMP68668.1 hypothetical protein [Pirellulaceae bacterium]